MFEVDEFSRSCEELALSFRVIEPPASLAYLSEVTSKFKPSRMSPFPELGPEATSVPLEPNEFSYSENLDDEPIYVFFDQGHGQQGNDKNRVIVLDDGRSLGKVIGNAFGLEYFVSNERQSYLLAVNWYVIEGVGAVDWLKRLASSDCR